MARPSPRVALPPATTATDWRASIKRWLARLLLISLCAFLIVQLVIFSLLWYWRDHPVDYSMFMVLHQLGGGTVTQQWVPYEAISPNLKRALVAAEDARFVSHAGFDWKGIDHAMRRNEKRGEVVAGGSTISQQLAKNLFLYNERSYLRKGQEAIATMMMERMWSKRRILEVYLNVIEFGEGIYGAQAAARHYYRIDAVNLSPRQAARLAAMAPAPRYFEDHPDSARLRSRTRAILNDLDAVKVPR